MRVRRSMSFGLVGVLMLFLGTIGATPVLADVETVVSGPELDQAMAARADEDAASRETILNLLARDEMRGAAAQVGVDIQRVEAAVSLLSGEELREVAAQARLADESLAGGDEKIVIGTTVLIIALLIVIILVAAD